VISCDGCVFAATDACTLQELCESAAERSLVSHKAEAIIACYLDSQVPPSIQVSVDRQLVQVVLQQRHRLSPDVFCDAQVTKADTPSGLSLKVKKLVSIANLTANNIELSIYASLFMPDV